MSNYVFLKILIRFLSCTHLSNSYRSKIYYVFLYHQNICTDWENLKVRLHRSIHLFFAERTLYAQLTTLYRAVWYLRPFKMILRKKHCSRKGSKICTFEGAMCVCWNTALPCAAARPNHSSTAITLCSSSHSPNISSISLCISSFNFYPT